MTTETKKTRTPKNADSITKGALALPLQERVDLVEALRISIDLEVEGLKAAADQAEKIAKRS
jgi:hypothetical protein